MWHFKKEQKIFKIGEVNVGGQPGEYPTVLIGSIFYDRHRIVKDHVDGAFNKMAAEELLNRQVELSEKTANPCMVDIVALTPRAIRKYIDFVVDTSEIPILVDSSSMAVRVAGVEHAREVGLEEKIVYNSINYRIDKREIAALSREKVKAAVLLCYNPENVWPIGRVEILKGDSSHAGLLRIASDTGIEKLLVDSAVLDAPSISIAAEAIALVKEEFGLPCGGGPVNAISEWHRLSEFGKTAKMVCTATAVTSLQFAGASFVLYGPIEKADVVFPAAAMTDALIAYNARFHGVKPRTKNHPLRKIF